MIYLHKRSIQIGKILFAISFIPLTIQSITSCSKKIETNSNPIEQIKYDTWQQGYLSAHIQQDLFTSTSTSPLKFLQAEPKELELGLAVIETVAEAQLMDLGIFGGTNNGYQVVSKAFISQAGQCLMDVLGLDAGIALFNAIEGKVLDQQAFREALKKVVGKILDRTSKLVASGAVGAAIIITQWSYCMYKNRQAY